MAKEKMDQLIEELGASAKKARKFAKKELLKMAEEAVLPLLRKLEFQDDALNLGIVEVLGEIGDERAAPALCEFYQEMGEKYFRGGWESKEILLEAMGKIGGEHILDMLQKLAKSDQEAHIRERAEDALVELFDEGDEELTPINRRTVLQRLIEKKGKIQIVSDLYDSEDLLFRKGKFILDYWSPRENISYSQNPVTTDAAWKMAKEKVPTQLEATRKEIEAENDAKAQSPQYKFEMKLREMGVAGVRLRGETMEFRDAKKNVLAEVKAGEVLSLEGVAYAMQHLAAGWPQTKNFLNVKEEELEGYLVAFRRARARAGVGGNVVPVTEPEGVRFFAVQGLEEMVE